MGLSEVGGYVRCVGAVGQLKRCAMQLGEAPCTHPCCKQVKWFANHQSACTPTSASHKGAHPHAHHTYVHSCIHHRTATI